MPEHGEKEYQQIQYIRAAAQVGASTHINPLQQKIDALLGCQSETN